MFRYLGLSYKLLSTLFTTEGFLAGMSSHMYIQITFIIKLHSTLATIEGFFVILSLHFIITPDMIL